MSPNEVDLESRRSSPWKIAKKKTKQWPEKKNMKIIRKDKYFL